MTKKITWRLNKLPSPDEVRELVKDKLITLEEAREILFREEEVEKDRDVESYKQEIKFLRELIETLSKNNRTVVREYVTTQHYPAVWYTPYINWATPTVTYTSASGSNQLLASYSAQDSSFTNIQTF